MRLARKVTAWAAAGICAGLLAVAPAGAQTDPLAAASQRAHDYMAAGEFARAIPLYRQLTQALPDNPGLAFDLGLALHMAGREPEAAAELRRSLRLDPHSTPAQLYLADVYLSLGQPAPAVPLLRAAVTASPQDAQARENLATALLDLGRPREAAAEFRTLAATEPRSAPAWYGLGRSYAAEAQGYFDQLGRVAPGSGYWLALAAAARAKAGQLSGAFYLYRQSLTKTPALPGAHAAIAAIYRQAGHADWARTEEAHERQLGPPSCGEQPLACRYLAGNYGQILADASASPAALYWKSQAANQRAIQAFAHLGDLPASAERHELLATVHASAMDYAQAAAEWRQAYDLSSHDPAIGAQLAMAWMQLHDFTDAQPLLESLRRRQPGAAQLSFLLGDLWLEQQQPERAIPFLTASLRTDPKLVNAQRALAQAYLDTGQTRQAIPHLAAALPLDDDGSLHYQLARAYQASGEPQRASAALREYQRLHQAAEAAKQAAQAQIQIEPPHS